MLMQQFNDSCNLTPTLVLGFFVFSFSSNITLLNEKGMKGSNPPRIGVFACKTRPAQLNRPFFMDTICNGMLRASGVQVWLRRAGEGRGATDLWKINKRTGGTFICT